MPYVFSTTVNQTDAGATDTTFTATNPTHAIGDLLLHIVSNDNGATATTASAGWTELGTQSRQSANNSSVWYRLATVATTADPVFTGHGDGWAVMSIAVRDVDATTQIDAALASIT